MDARVEATISKMYQLRGDHLTIHQLSRSVNLSPSRLRQLFKKETGKSPTEYIKRLRILEVQQLLQTTFLSIKEITFLCGFNDVSHFVRDFKKRYGLTPSDFRGQSRGSRKKSSRGQKDLRIGQ